MAKFVKKSGQQKFYEIDGIRAAGIMPYMMKKNKIYVLINKEVRNKREVYNCIGGKVDRCDKTIYETMIREFNEETGFIVFDKMREYFKDFKYNNCIKMVKSKYLLYLLQVNEDDEDIWRLLPHNYQQIYKNVDKFNHRESLELVWIDLFDFNFNKNTSFLLKALASKVKKYNKFLNYDPDDPIELED